MVVAYQKGYAKKKMWILLDFTKITSLYLLIRFGDLSNYWLSLIFIVPTIVSYIRGRCWDLLFTAIIIIILNWYCFNFSIWLLIMEQMACFLAHYYIDIRKNIIKSILLLFPIKLVFISLQLSESGWLYVGSTWWDQILLIIFLFFMSMLAIYIIALYGDIANVYNVLESDDEEKRLRDSMFKITHEIKNPIAVCKGYLDMFDVENEVHYGKYIPIIKQEINRTLMLMNDFLNLARLNIVKQRFNLTVLLEDVCEICASLAKSKKIRFRSHYQEYDIYVYADYERLKQVFINVIKNAVEALETTECGEIIFNADSKLYKVVFTVIDNGPGMTKEQLLKVGEAFYSTKMNGTGLGVKFCREIIEAHNGTIQYLSKKNHGTRVIITIPKRKNPT